VAIVVIGISSEEGGDRKNLNFGKE